MVAFIINSIAAITREEMVHQHVLVMRRFTVGDEGIGEGTPESILKRDQGKHDAASQRKEIPRFAHGARIHEKERGLGEQTNDTYSRFKNTISLSVPSEDRAASMTVSLM